ncbi:MAG: VWA domain-containing protein [Polyangiaceae bacterium]
MKLKTTAILALCGVLASAAGAFAIPVSKAPAAGYGESGPIEGDKWWKNAQTEISRVQAGDTLLMDARLGHGSLGKSQGTEETYLFAQVSGAEGRGTSSAPPLNLALVIDRSGSMKGDRILNAMNAAVGAVERMRDGDSVTVVSFDTQAQLVVAPTRVTADNRGAIAAAIRSIRLGGDTCISCGLETAMRQLEGTTLTGDRVNRIVLLSDGATNHGVRDMGGLRAMAGRMGGKGVTISTIGVDVDFDEKVMAAIAAEANGRHYFVANSGGLPQVFAQEFDSLVSSVARDAELAIELAPGVEVTEVFDRAFRREGNRLLVSFGTFSAKQEKTVLVKLRVPADRDGARPVADVKLAYRDLTKNSDASCNGNLALLVKSDGSEQKSLDPFVAARLERSRTAQSLTEANKLVEAGRVADARAVLARRRTELRKTESQALAAATAQPFAAPKRAAKSIDRDFDDQLGAVAAAEQSFARPPAASPASPAGGGRFAQPAPLKDTREGKAQVRSNQAAASQFGF